MPRYICPLDHTTSYRNNWAYIQKEGCEEAIEHYGITPGRIYHPYAIDNITDCFRLLMKAYNDPSEDRNELMTLIMRQLFIYLRSTDQYRMDNSENDSYYGEQLAQIRYEMYNDVARAWNIADMAREIGISITWLDKLYRAKYGLSPKQDLLCARIERAKNYLTYTNIPLHIVAQRTGFQNEYYFNQVFRRHVGVPPGQYRHSKREEEP